MPTSSGYAPTSPTLEVNSYSASDGFKLERLGRDKKNVRFDFL